MKRDSFLYLLPSQIILRSQGVKGENVSQAKRLLSSFTPQTTIIILWSQGVKGENFSLAKRLPSSFTPQTTIITLRSQGVKVEDVSLAKRLPSSFTPQTIITLRSQGVKGENVSLAKRLPFANILGGLIKSSRYLSNILLSVLDRLGNELLQLSLSWPFRSSQLHPRYTFPSYEPMLSHHGLDK